MMMMQSVLTLTDRTTALVRPVITGMGLNVKVSLSSCCTEVFTSSIIFDISKLMEVKFWDCIVADSRKFIECNIIFRH